jgi:natural product precursor
MKKLSKLKLNNIDFQNLESREMKNIIGGAGNCTCGCCSTSSTQDNSKANKKDDLKTTCPEGYYVLSYTI